MKVLPLIKFLSIDKILTMKGRLHYQRENCGYGKDLLNASRLKHSPKHLFFLTSSLAV